MYLDKIHHKFTKLYIKMYALKKYELSWPIWLKNRTKNEKVMRHSIFTIEI